MKVLNRSVCIPVEPASYEGDSDYRRCIRISDILVQCRDGETRRVTIPKGYCCNGFSIPRWAKWVPGMGWRWQKGWEAAFFHDFMRQKAQEQVAWAWWSEKDADEIFYQLMKIQGVGWFKRKLFYGSVVGELWLRNRSK